MVYDEYRDEAMRELKAERDRLLDVVSTLAAEENLCWTGIVVQEYAQSALDEHKEARGK